MRFIDVPDVYVAQRGSMIGGLSKSACLTSLNDWLVQQSQRLTALNDWSVEEQIPTWRGNCLGMGHRPPE